jgi:hypothetical protein
MESYQTWEQSAVSLETLNQNKNTVLDIYQFPHGYKVMDYMVLPTNPFKPNYTYCVIDIVLNSNNNNVTELLKSFGGIQNDYYYTEDGYFLPEFKEIENQKPPMERAYDFLNNVIQFIKIN